MLNFNAQKSQNAMRGREFSVVGNSYLVILQVGYPALFIAQQDFNNHNSCILRIQLCLTAFLRGIENE